MANAAVLGSTFCSIAFKFFSRNDSRPQDPLINWSVVAMLEPEAMLGSLLGSVLYNWMPQSASVLLLVSVLGGISTRMLSVGMHEWQKTANPYVELESVEISPAAGVAAYRSMTEFSDAVHVTRPVGRCRYPVANHLYFTHALLWLHGHQRAAPASAPA